MSRSCVSQYLLGSDRARYTTVRSIPGDAARALNRAIRCGAMMEVMIVMRTGSMIGNDTGCRVPSLLSPRIERTRMNILGINAYHGDASAAILLEGQLVAAVEEERFTRVKHDTSFPHRSIRFCLDTAGLRPEDIDHFALSRNPKANLGKRVSHAIKDRAGRQVATRRAGNLRKILNAKQTLADGLGVPADRLKAKPHFVEHHLAHIASSYYVSPFDRAAVLSIDGFGDMISAMWGVGEAGKLRILGEIAFPHSLGVYYTAVTQYLGFPNYGDEYKVMGLASYGEPTYLDEFRRIVHSSGLGYDLNLEAFRHHTDGAAMTWDGG